MLDEPADGLEIVLQGKHHGPKFFQKILRAKKVDGEPGSGKFNATGQLSEAGAYQSQGAAVQRHPDLLRAGCGDQLRQTLFEAMAPAEFADALPARAQVLQRRNEILAGADESIAGALRRAAMAQDTPGDGLGNPQDFLKGV